MDLSPCIRYAIHPSIHPPIYTSYLPPNQSLTHLASLASTASHTLDTSSSHARELHQHHLDATHSASHLVHTLGQLADTAHDEIRKINDTAVLVRRGFFREEEKVGRTHAWETRKRLGANRARKPFVGFFFFWVWFNMLVKSSLIYCLFDFFLKIKYNLPMIIAIVDSLFLFFILKRMRIFCHRIKPWFYRAVNPIIGSLMGAT